MADAAPPSDVLPRILRILESGVADVDDLGVLVESLGDARKLVQRRAVDALVALQSQRDDVYARLLAALQAPLARQRWGAAFALAQMGVDAFPPLAIPVLIESLGVHDGDVRWAALEIVKQLVDNPQLGDRLRSLLTIGSPTQRKMAAYCLREIGTRAADTQAALLVALDDNDPAVRLAAMSSLARLATDPETVARRLLELLDDADARIRRSAAAALGELGECSDAVVRALGRAAQSPDASLRRAAERSLRLLVRG